MTKLHPGWTVLNRGINGQRSDEILRRFPRDVLVERPEYVIILAGVNDVYQGRSVEVVKTNLAAMYSRAMSARIRVVAATILPYNAMGPREAESIRDLNLWVREEARHLKFLYCDTNAAVADPEAPDKLRGSPDGLHPDVSGYRRMGERLARTIEDDKSAPPAPEP
jgi:lysophospholipase L1-like esterase